MLRLSKEFGVPVHNRPWLLLPLVTEWERTDSGGYRAVAITREKVYINDLYSLLNIPAPWRLAMFNYLNECDRQAEEAAKGAAEGARAGTRRDKYID